MYSEQDRTTRVNNYFNEDQTMTAYELGIDNLGALIDYTDGYVELRVNEPLNFHKEYSPKFSELCLDEESETTTLDFDREFKEELEYQLDKQTGLNTNVTISENTDSDTLTFEIGFKYDGTKLMKELENDLWDLLATWKNVSDPGTFGHEYIMRTVTEKLEK